MNPNTGAIATFEKASDAIKAGFTVPLTKAQAEKLLPMNRKQRRAWESDQRRARKSTP